MKYTKKFLLFIFIFLFIFLLYSEKQNKNIKNGNIKTIKCSGNNNHSYYIYLPSNYSKEKNWPIIYTFDPGGNGHIPVELFQNTAEKYGYIIVGSNNVKNGPWSSNIKALKELWYDTNKKFSIKPDQIYTSGFSGGARVAAAFSSILGTPVSGIVACGAGLPSSMKVEQLKQSFYHGIVGLMDFNYREMLQLKEKLEQAQIKHIIEITDNEHKWPSEQTLTRAVGVFEILNLKNLSGIFTTAQIKKQNKELINNIYNEFIQEATQKEKSGNIYYALEFYKYTYDIFKDLLSSEQIENIKKKITDIKNSKQYKQAVDKMSDIKKQEQEYIRNFLKVFSKVENKKTENIELSKISKQMNLEELIDKTKNSSFYEKFMAKRLLNDLSLKTYKKGRDYKENNLKKSILFFEISSEANKENPYLYYSLACFYSLNKNKEKALENLEKSFEKGFDNFEHLKQDKQLDFIRNDDRFKEIIKKYQK